MRYSILHTGAHKQPDTTVYEREFDSVEEVIRQFESDFPGRTIVHVKEI